MLQQLFVHAHVITIDTYIIYIFLLLSLRVCLSTLDIHNITHKEHKCDQFQNTMYMFVLLESTRYVVLQ